MEYQEAKGPDHTSTFRGFDLSHRNYALNRFQCGDCPNTCEINEVVIEGEAPLYYGSRCDKYNLRKKRRKLPPEKDLFRKREELLTTCMQQESRVKPTRGRVGIPRALIQHEMLPFWYTLMRELGYEVVVSPTTNRVITQKGVEAIATETCFPVKVAHGHVLELIGQGVDAVLLPSVISAGSEFKGQDISCFCPYVQTIPYVIRATIEFPPNVRVMTFPVRFEGGLNVLMKDLQEAAREHGWTRAELRRALVRAEEAQQEFQRRCREEGRKVLENLRREDHPVVVIARPYNGCDRGVNLDLPRKLAELDMLAIPLDFLPLDEVELSHEWDNMFWRYGQKIIAAANFVCKHPLLTAIYVTNFSCGPDSFLITFFRKSMGEKPALLLEIDEHSADAGVLTRLEAFLDSLKGAEDRRVSKPQFAPRTIVRSSGRRIYVPHMCEHAHAFAAAFRNAGMDAEVLPESDESSLELGRQYTTGKECLPAIVTAGDMLKKVYSSDFDRRRGAFFMPGGSGPCRFGQYNRLHRFILKEAGYEDVPILSPNQGKSFYDDFRKLEKDPTRLAWQGIVAVDMLVKVLHRIRPYEMETGLTDHVFQECLRNLCETMEAGGDLEAAVQGCVRDMANIRTAEDGRRPVVGVVGEIYVRSHDFSNASVVRQLESMGAQVNLAGFCEWIYYTNAMRARNSRRERDFVATVKEILKNWVQKMDERRIGTLFKDVLPEPLEPPIEQIVHYAGPYLHDSFEGEAVLSIGKTVEYFHQRASGVVNVMPFTCMPGSIVTALLKRVREDHEQMPVVSLSYDGQPEGSTLTRLEAFMHQVKEFHRRKTRCPTRTYAGATVGRT
jgi:predicted nucleotide-binding protein (sugar kinase/HSP70/actin superfamily)